jgi:hypothetical protein
VVLIIMSDNNSEMRAYLKNEWKNDRSWMTERPVCCPKVEDGILVSVVAKFRGVGKALEEAYGKIACCL